MVYGTRAATDKNRTTRRQRPVAVINIAAHLAARIPARVTGRIIRSGSTPPVIVPGVDGWRRRGGSVLHRVRRIVVYVVAIIQAAADGRVGAGHGINADIVAVNVVSGGVSPNPRNLQKVKQRPSARLL